MDDANKTTGNTSMIDPPNPLAQSNPSAQPDPGAADQPLTANSASTSSPQSPSATDGDQSVPVLPPVQPQAADDEDDNIPLDPQTVPADRALVPLPEEAADSDLIEKEWVLKAKQIVEQTAEDPFKQQEALSKMKAEYLKKRYNKDIG